jgi:hypothetical protein
MEGYTSFPIGEPYQDTYLVFQDGFTEFDEFDTPMRGYRSGVYLDNNGQCYPLYFYDPYRLSADLESTMEWDEKYRRNYIAEHGIVIIPEVSLKNMLDVVYSLLDKENYFNKQKHYSVEEVRLLIQQSD